MRTPPIKDLMKNVDCRYTLVVEVAKRARQLVGGAEPMAKSESNKPVIIAAQEIGENKISYDGVKELE
jgi:DNA-directed RNA polymerase subunit omega